MRALTAARYWTLAPALLLFVAVALVPIGELVAMSLARIDWVQGKAQWHFVGLEQYARVLRDALFRTGVANTIVFAVSAVTAFRSCDESGMAAISSWRWRQRSRHHGPR